MPAPSGGAAGRPWAQRRRVNSLYSQNKGMAGTAPWKEAGPFTNICSRIRAYMARSMSKIRAVGQGESLDERRGREDKASEGSNKRLIAALTRNLRKTFLNQMKLLPLLLPPQLSLQDPTASQWPTDSISRPAAAAEAEGCRLQETQIWALILVFATSYLLNFRQDI